MVVKMMESGRRVKIPQQYIRQSRPLPVVSLSSSAQPAMRNFLKSTTKISSMPARSYFGLSSSVPSRLDLPFTGFWSETSSHMSCKARLRYLPTIVMHNLENNNLIQVQITNSSGHDGIANLSLGPHLRSIV